MRGIGIPRTPVKLPVRSGRLMIAWWVSSPIPIVTSARNMCTSLQIGRATSAAKRVASAPPARIPSQTLTPSFVVRMAEVYAPTA